MASPRAWLMRHDPGLAIVRRAARVTLVACVAFYLCRYVLDNVTMAPYALFGVVAMGALSQIPGSPAAARPHAAGRAAGRLGPGHARHAAVGHHGDGRRGHVRARASPSRYAGVGGPRLVGLAAGTQLLYILPCFPPFDPGSLRLPAGRAHARRAAARRRRGHALARRHADAVHARSSATPSARSPAAWTRWPTCGRGGPKGGERFAARAARGDRRGRGAAALADAAGAAARLRGPPRPRARLGRGLGPAAAGPHGRPLARRRPLRRHAPRGRRPPAPDGLVRRRGRGLAARREAEEVPDTDRIAAALDEFRAARDATSPDGLPPERLQLGSLALSLGEWTKSMVAAIRVAAGAPIPPDPTPAVGAARPALVRLPQHRRAVVAPAPRAPHAALGLLPGRAAAGAGARGSPAARRGVRPFARLLGAAHRAHPPAHLGRGHPLDAAARAGRHHGGRAGRRGAARGRSCPRRCTRSRCPSIMLVGFAAGPLLGPGWAQALFTLVIAFVFAQVSPVDWRLAEARIVDVVIGAGDRRADRAPRLAARRIGRAAPGHGHVPRGGARTSCGRRSGCSPATPAQGGALPRAREAGMLADASYALYQTERHPPRGHRLAGHPRGGPPRRARRRGAAARLPDGLPAAVPRRR